MKIMNVWIHIKNLVRSWLGFPKDLILQRPVRSQPQAPTGTKQKASRDQQKKGRPRRPKTAPPVGPEPEKPPKPGQPPVGPRSGKPARPKLEKPPEHRRGWNPFQKSDPRLVRATPKLVSVVELSETLPILQGRFARQLVAVFSRPREASLLVITRNVSTPLNKGGACWERSDMRAFEQQWPMNPQLTENDAICQLVWNDEPLSPPAGVATTAWIDVPRATALLLNEGSRARSNDGVSAFRIIVVDLEAVRSHDLTMAASPTWFPWTVHEDWESRIVNNDELAESVADLIRAGKSKRHIAIVLTPHVEKYLLSAGASSEPLRKEILQAQCPYFTSWKLLRAFSWAWRGRLLVGHADWPPDSRSDYHIRSPRSFWGGLASQQSVVHADQLSVSRRFSLSPVSRKVYKASFEVHCPNSGTGAESQQSLLEVDLRDGPGPSRQPVTTLDICPGTGAQRLTLEWRGPNGSDDSGHVLVTWPRVQTSTASAEVSSAAARITVCLTVDRTLLTPQYLRRAAFMIHGLAKRKRLMCLGLVSHDGSGGDNDVQLLTPKDVEPLGVDGLARWIGQLAQKKQERKVRDLSDAVVSILSRDASRGGSEYGARLLLIAESHFQIDANSPWRAGLGRWAWAINTRRLLGASLSVTACMWKEPGLKAVEGLQHILEHLVLLGRQARCTDGLVRIWTPNNRYDLEQWAATEVDALCDVTAHAGRRSGVAAQPSPRPSTVWVTGEGDEVIPEPLHRYELAGGCEKIDMLDLSLSEIPVSLNRRGPLKDANAFRVRLTDLLK